MLTSKSRALDLLFKFCTSFCMRVVPPLFLRDMCHVSLAPSSQERPKTAMLRNALVGLALAFLDDSKFRDLKTRLYFIDRQRVTWRLNANNRISALSKYCLLGSFYGGNKVWDSYISVGESESQGVYLFRYFSIRARRSGSTGM